MKRVKIMLMSLLVLAVVGGALAFKAKFEEDYCTTLAVQTVAGGAFTCNSTNGNRLTCPNYEDLVTTTTQGNLNIVCTTTTNGNIQNPCSPVNNCRITTYKITDNDPK
jgi:hypothetical protein